MTTPRPRRVLVLGGTSEGREVAERLAREPAVRVVSSLAGRVADPRLPAGDVRVGGFGGSEGLARWLRHHEVDAVIDATHPFASTITTSAARAAAQTHIPLIVLHRPAWGAVEGDRWTVVSSMDEAATALPALGRRALLTIGRQEVAAFAQVDAVWFLIRCIDPPAGPTPPRHQLLRARGPFTLADELDLLRDNEIDVIVSKNSGGAATRAKVDAARRLGLPMLIVDRPPPPAGVGSVSSVDAALAWVSAQSG